MAKLWGAEERRPQSRADCLLWALLGFFLLVEGLVLSTAFLPSFDSAAQQQEQEQRPQHPAPTAADRQVDRAAEGRPASGGAEDGGAANFTSRRPRTVGGTAPPPGTESSPSTATAVPGRHEDGEGGKDRRATTFSALVHVSRRWLLP